MYVSYRSLQKIFLCEGDCCFAPENKNKKPWTVGGVWEEGRHVLFNIQSISLFCLTVTSIEKKIRRVTLL